MRKAFVLLFALILALGACSVPVDGIDGTAGSPGTNGSDGVPGTDGQAGTDATVEKANVHVVNSAWEIVYEARFDARAVQSIDFIDKMVADFNGSHTDDQWRVIYGDVPPVDSAPTTDAYIIDSALTKLVEVHGLPRSGLPDKRESLREEAVNKNGVLYIDKDPPVPPPPVPDYVKYALYLVAGDGTILYEEHCATAEKFAERLDIYNRQAQADGNGEHVISGRLYP